MCQNHRKGSFYFPIEESLHMCLRQQGFSFSVFTIKLMYKKGLKTPKGIPRASGYQQAGVTKSQGLPISRGYQQPGFTNSQGLPTDRGYQQTGVTNSRNSKENYKIVNRKGQTIIYKTLN